MEWTKVSEKMPPVGEPLIVTIEDKLNAGKRELRYPVYHEKSAFSNDFHWRWKYGDLDYELLQDVSSVVAWARMPEPYQSDNAWDDFFCLNEKEMRHGNIS